MEEENNNNNNNNNQEEKEEKTPTKSRVEDGWYLTMSKIRTKNPEEVKEGKPRETTMKTVQAVPFDPNDGFVLVPSSVMKILAGSSVSIQYALAVMESKILEEYDAESKSRLMKEVIADIRESLNFLAILDVSARKLDHYAMLVNKTLSSPFFQHVLKAENIEQEIPDIINSVLNCMIYIDKKDRTLCANLLIDTPGTRVEGPYFDMIKALLACVQVSDEEEKKYREVHYRRHFLEMFLVLAPPSMVKGLSEGLVEMLRKLNFKTMPTSMVEVIYHSLVTQMKELTVKMCEGVEEKSQEEREELETEQKRAMEMLGLLDDVSIGFRPIETSCLSSGGQTPSCQHAEDTKDS